MLAYLRAENAYFEAAMAPHQPLIDTLFQEMRGRIKEDDSSVPVRDGDWLYWWAFQPGAQYRSWYRQPGRAAATEQLIFDEPAEAEGKQYFRLGALEVSPDGRYAATMVDDDGSERFKLRIRDLATGRDIETVTEVGIGAAGLDRRQPGDRLHRGQRELAQLPRPAAPARRAAPRTTHALRGDRERRLHGRRRPHPGPQLHLHHDRREQSRTRSASCPPTIPRPTPVLIARAPAEHPNIRSMPATASCGS